MQLKLEYSEYNSRHLGTYGQTNEAAEKLVVDETMSEEIKQLNSKPDIEVSEIIVGLNPIDEQLYELMAEDLAIDDTLYVLDKSLQMGLCDLSQFLKNLRDLGRKQFKTRSLIKLIKNQKSLGT
ncbi:hypothetical protein HDU92_005031 [Lobulomyces angularis]|nr:hypothetical protein HDU92_005031 [Lobulomyces angularis]